MLDRSAPNECVWTDQAVKAFDDLRQALTTEPLLAYADPSRLFYLKTDASQSAVSAILTQFEDNGREHVIEYASKLLNVAERNYSNPERECFAALFGMQHFRSYLYGIHFILVVDHEALKYIQTYKESNARLVRWSIKMQDFDFDVVYKPGREHRDADSLTRMNVAHLPDTSSISSMDVHMHGIHEDVHMYDVSVSPVSTYVHAPPLFDLPTLKAAQCIDTVLSPVYFYLLNGQLPTHSNAKQVARLIRFAKRFELKGKDCLVLYRKPFKTLSS